MIKTLIEILQADDWYGVSETIEIAKGKYKPKNKTKDIIQQNKRKWQMLRKR